MFLSRLLSVRSARRAASILRTNPVVDEGTLKEHLYRLNLADTETQTVPAVPLRRRSRLNRHLPIIQTKEN